MGGGGCFGIGGYFAFDGSHTEILMEVLPPILHLRKEADKAALRWCLERCWLEVREPRPGGALIAEHLAHMLLVQALRLHMEEGARGGVGWLFALADRQMSAAIPGHACRSGPPLDLARPGRRSPACRARPSRRSSRRRSAPRRWTISPLADAAGRDRLNQLARPDLRHRPGVGLRERERFSTAFKRLWPARPGGTVEAAAARGGAVA